MSVRLSFEMLDELKEIGKSLVRPYQAVMKDAIARGLPIVKEIGATEKKLRKDSKTSRSLNVAAAMEKIRATVKKAKSKSK